MPQGHKNTGPQDHKTLQSKYIRHSDLGKIKYLPINYFKDGKTKWPENLQKSNSA